MVYLTKTALAIRDIYQDKRVAIPLTDSLDEPEEEFKEGKILTRMHKTRERNPRLVERKKATVRAKTGALRCEVCNFDFAEVYGALGEGFAECHHLLPLSELNQTTVTRLDDLAIVCANCHRMLHRPSRYSIEKLREIVLSRK